MSKESSKLWQRKGCCKKNVLVVDDNVNVQRTIAQITSEIGLNPVCVGSRREAIYLIDRQAFDVAFVDKQLVERDSNNRDGIAIIKAIFKKQEGTRAIFFTGWGQYSDAVEIHKIDHDIIILEKSSDFSSVEPQIVEAITTSAKLSSVGKIEIAPQLIWRGAENALEWIRLAKIALKPLGGESVLIDALAELADTCCPVYQNYRDGLRINAINQTLWGYFWSRRLGNSVAIMVTSDESKQMEDCHWPENLKILDRIFMFNRKNLIVQGWRGSGYDHTDFPHYRSEKAISC